MKSTRRLALHKESLTELVADEMRRVAGGTHITCEPPTHGTSWDVDCEVPTNPINHCLTVDTCTPLTFPTA